MTRGRSSKPGRRLAAIARANKRAEAYCAELRAMGVRPTVAALLRSEEKWLDLWDAESIIHRDTKAASERGEPPLMGVLIDVPAMFWNDHAERCPSDKGQEGICREVQEMGRRVRIVGTPEQIEALRSDAAFYAGDNVDDCPGLQRSARATLEAIAKVMEGRHE